jgi:hypothetical protein
VERREHRVGLAGLSAHGVEVVDREQSRMPERRDLQSPAHARDAPPRERPDVLAVVQLDRADLARQRGQLTLGRPAPQHEDPAEPLVEVRQAFEHEPRARTGRVAAAQEPLVEAEHGNDALAAIQCGAQRGVVVHAQVAREPEQRGHASCSAR